MNGREVRNGAQMVPDMTGETSREVGTGGVDARPRGSEYNAEQARGIGGLAMGQVLTYNPEATGQFYSEEGVARSETMSRIHSGVESARSGAEVARPEVGAPEFRAVQGRDASGMMGVAGENLRQLEHLPEQMRIQNERIREQVELENGYARNEIAPNLSSVGLASEVERAEYQAADLANAEAELAPVTFEDEIQNKSQEEVGKVMADRMGKLLKQKSFQPKDVAEWRDKGMLQMFERFQNKRVFKERNG